jgi:hypothetical protein
MTLTRGVWRLDAVRDHLVEADRLLERGIDPVYVLELRARILAAIDDVMFLAELLDAT